MRHRVAERLELAIGFLGGELRGGQIGDHLLALGDVVRDPEQVGRISRAVAQRDLLGMEPALAVLGVDRLLDDLDRRQRRQGLAIPGDEELGLAGGKEVEVGLADQLVARPSEELLAGPVELDERELLGILDEHHVGNVLDDRIEQARRPHRAFLGRAQLLAALELLEQPRVADRERGVVRQILDDLEIELVERRVPGAVPQDPHHAVQLAARRERDDQHPGGPGGLQLLERRRGHLPRQHVVVDPRHEQRAMREDVGGDHRLAQRIRWRQVRASPRPGIGTAVVERDDGQCVSRAQQHDAGVGDCFGDVARDRIE